MIRSGLTTTTLQHSAPAPTTTSCRRWRGPSRRRTSPSPESGCFASGGAEGRPPPPRPVSRLGTPAAPPVVALVAPRALCGGGGGRLSSVVVSRVGRERRTPPVVVCDLCLRVCQRCLRCLRCVSLCLCVSLCRSACLWSATGVFACRSVDLILSPARSHGYCVVDNRCPDAKVR